MYGNVTIHSNTILYVLQHWCKIFSMANRKKLAGSKFDTPIQLRVSKDLKDALDQLATTTGVSTSERARQCLERVVAEHQKKTSTP